MVYGTKITIVNCTGHFFKQHSVQHSHHWGIPHPFCIIEFSLEIQHLKTSMVKFPGTILRQARGDLSGLGGIEKTHLLPEIGRGFHRGISSMGPQFGNAKLVQITIITSWRMIRT